MPRDRQPPRVELERTDQGTLHMEMSGAWDRILDATVNAAVAEGLVTQAARLGVQRKAFDLLATDFAMGFVDAMQPRDAAEALLLTQMAATHLAVITLTRHLKYADTLPQKDCAEKALNKTARTFTTQMERLKRYRAKGQQTVRVERVTIEDGGQAIVGNFVRQGEGNHET